MSCEPVPFVKRSQRVEFSVTLAPDAADRFLALAEEDREIVVTLGPDETWPKGLHRGQTVDLMLTGMDGGAERFEGRVRYRRLGRVVLEGRITPAKM